jgi:hypothetical protein
MIQSQTHTNSHSLHLLLAVLSTILCFSPTGLADQEDKLLKRVAQAEEAFQKSATKVVETVLECYDRSIEVAQKQGDFKYMDRLEDERRVFEQKHRRPKLIDDLKYRQAISIACERCLLVYADAIGVATKANDLQLAKTLQSQKDSFEKTVESDYPGARIFRKKWVHPLGDFSTTNGTVWIENTPTNRYSFIETSRDLNCVYLFDQARNMTVVLGEKSCLVKGAKSKGRVTYFGTWKD